MNRLNIDPRSKTTTLRTLLCQALFRWGLFSVCTLACFALSPTVRAVDPPPDGGYPGANTAEGDVALLSLTTGSNNTAVGYQALSYNNTGNQNTATGAGALALNTFGTNNTASGSGALESNTNASNNTATGTDALFYNTTGSENTATGAYALVSNSVGFYNTATGYEALFYNTTGFENTAIGYVALQSNTTGLYNTASGSGALQSNNGDQNTADGWHALHNNTTGSYNTANGSQALPSNTTGSNNTASGNTALFLNTTGGSNTATGADSLHSNTIGNNNTASGGVSLYLNTTGSNNTAEGYSALRNNTIGNSNTAEGNLALENNTSGGSNIAIGDSAGLNLTTGSNNIDIGNKGVAGESKTIRIGKKGTQTTTVIAGINGTTVAGGVGVIIDTNGKLGTIVSSARYKDAIKPMDRASEAILALKPVTFRYKKDLDPDAIPQFGLVAEEVEKVNPALVARDEQGKAYTVRYEAVNAMLLNEFLKEHRKVQELGRKSDAQAATIIEMKSSAAKQDAIEGRLESMLKQQQEEIAALTSQLRSVKTGLEADKASSPLVAHNP